MNAGSLAEQVKLAVSRGASSPLDTCPAVCGAVATGFGRGSKKLGVPTANLPCSLFQTTLNDLSCGVYIGWAVVRGSLYKCVANIGFSPTFVDAENPEKMVEAHLLHVFHDDFYHEPLALLLVGFIRAERKFNSFDELVTTIRADIETARLELDQPPYHSMRHARWLRSKLITPDLDSTGPVFELLPPADLLADEPSTADGIIVGLPPAGFEWGSIF